MNKLSKHIKEKIISFEIDGMHCVSCAMNIDGNLEDTPGVIKAETNFARSLTKVSFDSEEITSEELKKIIEETGYTVINSV